MLNDCIKSVFYVIGSGKYYWKGKHLFHLIDILIVMVLVIMSLTFMWFFANRKVNL